MNGRGRNSGRNTLPAVFLGFVMPGLGQIYNGELVKGISFFIIILSLAFMGTRWTLLLPDSMMIFGTLATIAASFAVGIYSIVDAFNKASKADASYQPKIYNRWYFYVAAWLLGRVALGGVYGYVTDNYMEAYRIPTQSMEPAVLQGDHVLADKTAYHRIAPKKGDVVIFVSPDDRSKRFIKRIEALPGDTITSADGTKLVVPHGFAYVLGDNRENSLDSRHFGFIPLSDVIAKVRQVYYSSGVRGILWGRIGKTVVSSQ